MPSSFAHDHLIMIAAVNQVHILQLSLQFKASGVAMTAVIFGDVF